MQTMSDFASISDKLALMPDPALQQFAQMNKDDPFSLALAVSESNRRRKMRAAQQGDAGMQQQPPVADQEIAQMNAPVMPENVGIGALPAPSMAGMPAGGIAGEEEMEPQTMAGGGMVAFARGGDVERYQFGGQPPASGGTEFAIPGMTQPSRSFMPQPGAPENTPFFQRLLASGRETGRQYELAQAQARIAAGVGTAADRALIAAYMEGNAPVSATTDVGARAAVAAAPTGAASRLLDPAIVQPAGAPPGTVPEATGAAPAARPPAARPPSATAAQPRPPAGPAASAAATVPGIGGLDVDKLTAAALKTAGETPNPFAAAQKEVGEEKVKAAEENVTGLQAIQKQFSDIYKGKKERLDTKEAELGKLKDQGLGLALLQAGAAMMSTPGGLGMALGKGVKVGSEQYVAGMDRFRSAQEKLSDARDRLEEIEAQRGEMSARELFKARNDVKNTGISAKEDMIKSNMQMYGVNRETAMKMVDNRIKVGVAQLEVGSREKIANMEAASRAAAAARNPQLELLERLGAAPPDSALAKGFELSKQEGLIPRLYEQYTKQASDPLTGADFVRKFPTFEVYRAGMGGANQRGIIPGVPSNAPVRAP